MRGRTRAPALRPFARRAGPRACGTRGRGCPSRPTDEGRACDVTCEGPRRATQGLVWVGVQRQYRAARALAHGVRPASP